MEKIKNIYGIEFGYKETGEEEIFEGKPVKKYYIYYIDGENEFPLDKYGYIFEHIKPFIDNIGRITVPKNEYGDTFFNVISVRCPESEYQIIGTDTFIRYDDHMELVHEDNKFIHSSFQDEVINKKISEYSEDSRLFEQRKSWILSKPLNEVLEDINKNDKIKKYLLEKELLPSLYEDLKVLFYDEYLDEGDVNRSFHVPTIGEVWVLMKGCQLQFHQRGYSLDNITKRVDNMTNEEIINYIFAGLINYKEKLIRWNTNYGQDKYAKERLAKEDAPIIRRSEQELLDKIGDPRFYSIYHVAEGTIFSVSDNSFTVKRTFYQLPAEYKEHPLSSYQGDPDELHEGQTVKIESCTKIGEEDSFDLVFNGQDYSYKKRR